MKDIISKFKFLALTQKSLKILPNTIGVYIFKNSHEVLYIGKSTNIKARVDSHIKNARLDVKENALTSGSDKVGYLICDGEFKALLLESQMIAHYKPRYNSRWRDDKSYLYINITKTALYPKILPVRRPKELGQLEKLNLFGPFPTLSNVEQVLREIRKIIPYCCQKQISNAACFYSKIGLCNPCPNTIEKIEDITKKKNLKTIYRKNINLIIKTLLGNSDKVLNQFYTKLNELKKAQKYEQAICLRDKIVKFEKLIYSTHFDGNESNWNRSKEAIVSLVDLVGKHLPIKNNLNRIECYDVSNLSFQEATASMVVLIDGMVDKSQYRRFKLKNNHAASDFAMLYEVFRRRFKNNWPLPDLILVDGGKPQVRTVKHALNLEKKHIPLVGLAKRPDRLIFYNKIFKTVRPPLNHLGFNLLRLLRDEAHRFARKYHLFLRSQKLSQKMV